MTIAAFPDLRFEAEDVLVDGDKVVARTRFTGTHQGDFVGVPASGKHVDVALIDIIRFGDDGLAHEHWGVMDELALMQQLGANPRRSARLGRDRAQAARERRPGPCRPCSRGFLEQHREGEAGGGVRCLARHRVGHLEGDAERGRMTTASCCMRLRITAPVSSLMTPSVKMR